MIFCNVIILLGFGDIFLQAGIDKTIEKAFEISALTGFLAVICLGLAYALWKTLERERLAYRDTIEFEKDIKVAIENLLTTQKEKHNETRDNLKELRRLLEKLEEHIQRISRTQRRD